MADSTILTYPHLPLLGYFIEGQHCSPVDVADAVGLSVDRVLMLLDDLERARLLVAAPTDA